MSARGVVGDVEDYYYVDGSSSASPPSSPYLTPSRPIRVNTTVTSPSQTHPSPSPSPLPLPKSPSSPSRRSSPYSQSSSSPPSSSSSKQHSTPPHSHSHSHSHSHRNHHVNPGNNTTIRFWILVGIITIFGLLNQFKTTTTTTASHQQQIQFLPCYNNGSSTSSSSSSSSEVGINNSTSTTSATAATTATAPATTSTFTTATTDESSMPTKKIQKYKLGPIFYNYFIPTTSSEATQNAISIAQEQMIQRSTSEPNSTLLYTLIGYKENITNDWCLPNCQQREYLPFGDEIDTYHALWKYCLNPQHSHEIVTYIHDRGSFHNHFSEMKSRRFGTKAAFDCRKILLENNNTDQCNVCTSKFWSLPQFLASANMWTTTCDYVSQLISPKIYSSSLKGMYEDTTIHPIHSQVGNRYSCLTPPVARDIPNHTEAIPKYHQSKINNMIYGQNKIGLNRYAAERYIFDHPNVEPCDVLPMPLGKAPHTFPQDHLWEPKFRKITGLQTQWAHHTYDHLVGKIYEWLYLYGKVPPSTSWLWNADEKGKEVGAIHWIRTCLNVSEDIPDEDIPIKYGETELVYQIYNEYIKNRTITTTTATSTK